MFIGSIHPLQNHNVATIDSQVNQASGAGTVLWTWKDDSGDMHSYNVRNMLFFLALPINILSITELANQLNDSIGMGITTFCCHLVFFWDSNKFTGTIHHPASNLPEMPVNEGSTLHYNWTQIVGTRVSLSKYHCHANLWHFIPPDNIDQPLTTAPKDDHFVTLQFHVWESLLYSNAGHVTIV